MDSMKYFIEALEKGKAFDWLLAHGHELNKYELIDIIKEYDYAVQDNLHKYDVLSVQLCAAKALRRMYLEEE